jgi:plastocyanin
MKFTRSASLALVVCTAVLGACSSESTSSATPTTVAPTVAPAETAAPDTAAPDTAAPDTAAPVDSAAPAGGVTLTIQDFAFSPATVAAGQPLTITNADDFPHTVTDSGGAFAVRVSGGASDTVTIDAPGTYSIVCEIHPSMAGTIVVR